MNPSPHPSVLPDLRWHVAGASVCGVRHARAAQPGQDQHCWDLVTDRLLVAAVSDGAGSARLGETGACIAAAAAVQAAGETLRSWAGWLPEPEEHEIWGQVLTHSLQEAHRRLAGEAVKLAAPLEDLATTLIVVIANPRLAAAAQIGDGAAVAADAQGNLTALSAPRHGEFVNETLFLTSDRALESAELAICPVPVTHVALLSDGLQMLALRMPDHIPHPEFFAPLWRFVDHVQDAQFAGEHLARFLTSPRIAARSDDDLTLVLAGLVPKNPSPLPVASA